jgi:hypothetical protein
VPTFDGLAFYVPTGPVPGFGKPTTATYKSFSSNTNCSAVSNAIPLRPAQTISLAALGLPATIVPPLSITP